LIVAGLVVVGVLGWALIKVLFSLFFYVLVGAALVGGGIYVYGRAKRAIGGGRRGIGR